MIQAFSTILSLFILIIGCTVMGIWWLDQSLLQSFNPNLIIIVYNAGLCFALAGAALLIPNKGVSSKRIKFGIGLAICIFSGLVLSQDLTGISLGIDQLFARVRIEDINPHPGRMAPQTSACFMLCGLVIAFLQFRRIRGMNVVIQMIILTVMITALIGIATINIRLDLLYDWYRFSGMALPTALCFFLLSIALWITWYFQEARHGAYLERMEKRISVTGTAIITLVAISAGMSGFGILANQMEHTLELSLLEAYKSNSNLVNSDIDLCLFGAEPITTRLLLKRNLALLNTSPGNAEAISVVKEDMESFIGKKFLGASVSDISGRQIAEAGKFAEHAKLKVPIKSDNPYYKLQLLWDTGLILRSTLPIEQNGEVAGSATVEQRLSHMQRLLLQEIYLGKSAEMRVCYAESESRMHCLPSNHHPEPFAPEARVRENASLPMDSALRGLEGIRIAKDYRSHQVISAYGPIGQTGLGMVVKIDAAEFYGPIREKLEIAIGLVLLLSGAGIFAQGLQLVPLVQRLIKSEERVKSIMISVADGIITINEKGVIESVNPALCDMFGYADSELVGQEAAVLMPPRLHSLESEGMEHFLSLGEAQIVGKGAIELPARHKDGHEFTILLTISSIRLDEEKLLVGSMRDVTERKRLDKLKTEFISTVSHELRTPLTSIRGSLGLMKAGIAGSLPAKAKEMTEIAYKNCERLILLINDILDIDKIESGEMRFDMREENLNSLISQAIEANAAYGEKFGVRFVLTPLASPPFASVDASRFIQVMSNLLSNAAKFSRPGDDVSIAIARKSGEVLISVADNGPGIPVEFTSRIFSKFAQADSSSSRQKSGTGLGLNISKQIIERMKGKIGFVSEINKGTIFWITLPEATARNPDADLAEAIEYLTANELGSLPRILHAEDNYDFCRIISHSLQGKAIVHVAATVEDASKLLESHSYDLLILDLALPDGSGLRLLSQIKESGQYTRVMILSASEVDEATRGKVAMALVKSKISEDKIVEHILALIRKQPYLTGTSKKQDL